MGSCVCNNKLNVISVNYKKGFLDSSASKFKFKKKVDFENESNKVENEISLTILKNNNPNSQSLNSIKKEKIDELKIDPFNINLIQDLKIGPFINIADFDSSIEKDIFNLLSTKPFKKVDFKMNYFDIFFLSLSKEIILLKKYFYQNKNIFKINYSKGLLLPPILRLSFMIIFLENNINNPTYQLLSFNNPESIFMNGKKIRNYDTRQQTLIFPKIESHFFKSSQNIIKIEDDNQINNLKGTSSLREQDKSRSKKKLLKLKTIDVLTLNNRSNKKSSSKVLLTSNNLTEKEKEDEKVLSEYDQYMKVKTLIEMDINRTYIGDKIRGNENIHQNLKDVLLLITQIDSELGYLQGMNYIVDHLLIISGNNRFFSLNLFFLFFNLKSNLFKLSLRDCIINNFNNFSSILSGFNEIFYKSYPNIFNKFIKFEIIEHLWISKWILTLYTYEFSYNLSLIFLELLSFYGFDLLIFLGLFFIDEFKNELDSDKCFDTESTLNVLNKSKTYDEICPKFKIKLIDFLDKRLNYIKK